MTPDESLEVAITVAEVYDRLTYQGEGPTVGLPCTFVRLGLCNLSCVWCDTPYTWDWTGKNGTAYDKGTELHRTTVGDVLARADDVLQPLMLHTGQGRLVVTGGEPLIQKRALRALVTEAVERYGWYVEVETNGTLLPHDDWNVAALGPMVQWNVSPKLGHSGMSYDDRIDEEVLAWWTQQRNVALKFVCRDTGDVAEVQGLLKRMETLTGERVWPSQVYIMPEGITTAANTKHAQQVAEAALAQGYNMTTRLHVQLWGTERGR